jgi:hypothetical protein
LDMCGAFLTPIVVGGVDTGRQLAHGLVDGEGETASWEAFHFTYSQASSGCLRSR